MSAEETKAGDLIFELEEDALGHETLVVTKSSDLEGWITFVRCPESEIEWSKLRNNCYPLNGRGGPPPIGRWVIGEYVGKEHSSINLSPDVSERGFTEEEIRALLKVVNIMYRDSTKVRSKASEEALSPKFPH